ncbi:MAG TPA: hypothetical protein VGQ00_01200 [Candidatus Norongarragalinales archaeon]|jgi:DNA replication initiation complex subunit (GINS family)|nr:hypothetical protein [Candidatus Norongarragalinales archaeon]
MLELSYEALRKVHLQEKHYAVLAPIDEEFYKGYEGFLQKQSDNLKQKFSLEEVKVYENTIKTLQNVVELREQKIMLKAVLDLRAGQINSSALAAEEKDLYIAIIKLLREYEDGISKTLSSSKTSPTSAVQPKNVQELVNVRILADLPEFVTADGKTRGPFTAQQEISLDKQTAELLIRKQAAENLESAITN